MQQRIKKFTKRNKRERERIFTCLCEQNIDRIEERIAHIYNKKNGEKKSQNKINMKGWRNCKVYRVVGRKKVKSGGNVRERVIVR